MLTAITAFASAMLAIGEVRDFKDWTVGCDNTLRCQAAGFPPVGEDGDYTLSFSRGPNAGDRPLVRVVGSQPERVVAVMAHGRRFDLKSPGADLAPGDMAAFIRAARKANTLSLLGEDGEQIDMISLAGASATFLYMDERQRRLGTSTALIRTGPSTNVPPPPAPPVIHAPPSSSKAPAPVDLSPFDNSETIASQIASIRSEKDLTEEQKNFIAQEIEIRYRGATEVHRLDAHSTLVLTRLGEGGAYNHEYLALVFDNNGAAVDAPFEVAADMSGETPNNGKFYGITNGFYDPQTGLLSGDVLCRGLGDCGVARKFVWDGAMFRLVSYHSRGSERGVIDWIPLWRANVVRSGR